MERFHSIQGEGAHAGTSAFFIRLASCRVGCPWCDTKESWSENNHPKITIQTLSEEAAIAASKGAAFLVITGGEPLHHNLDPLCSSIKKITSCQSGSAMAIHLETSGVDHLSGEHNWITLSPKRHAPPKSELLKACNEIKIIVNEQTDLIFAEEMAKQAIQLRTLSHELEESQKQKLVEPFLFLQPGWENRKGQDLAIKYVKNNPKWRLSMQTHKWLGLR